MEHIKSINEFFSFKEDFQRGKQKAIELSKGEEGKSFLRELIDNIKSLGSEKIEALKAKIQKFMNNPEEIKESNYIKEGFENIINRIGNILGLGAILGSLLGGFATFVSGALSGEPFFMIVGLIFTFIGLAIGGAQK